MGANLADWGLTRRTDDDLLRRDLVIYLTRVMRRKALRRARGRTAW
jgi:hypothetical protein